MTAPCPHCAELRAEVDRLTSLMKSDWEAHKRETLDWHGIVKDDALRLDGAREEARRAYETIDRLTRDNAVLHALLMRSGFAAFLRLKSQVDPSRPFDPDQPGRDAL